MGGEDDLAALPATDHDEVLDQSPGCDRVQTVLHFLNQDKRFVLDGLYLADDSDDARLPGTEMELGVSGLGTVR